MSCSFIVCSPAWIPWGQMPTRGHTFAEYERLLAETNRINGLKLQKVRRTQAKAKAKPKRLMPYQRAQKLRDMQTVATSARNERAAKAASRNRGPARIVSPWNR